MSAYHFRVIETAIKSARKLSNYPTVESDIWLLFSRVMAIVTGAFFGVLIYLLISA